MLGSSTRQRLDDGGRRLRRRSLVLLAALATLGGLMIAPGVAAAAAPVGAAVVPAAVQPAAAPVPLRPPGRRDHRTERTCASSDPNVLACNAIRQIDQDPPATVQTSTTTPGTVTPNAASPNATTAVVPAGYGPSELQSAYKVAGATGRGTVAIVDAFNDPNAESDLATYRSTFGLPACTTANGCFRKVNQRGAASPLPANDAGWAGEISLDVDMVSATCPKCSILLVEADSATTTNLGTAVNEAITLGAKYVSNSYGGPENGAENTNDTRFYNHPGVAITASSGDSGFGVQYPASGKGVTAVGGTSLNQASGTARGWSETVWSGAGSGCSADVAKPAFQSGLTTGCARRAEADVAAVADPQTGVAVYQTFGATGWQVYGGTSAAAPIIASVYALAGTPGATSSPNSFPYAHRTNLNDVTTGNNGTCGRPLCTAGAGYDGPTGLGTPNGTAAFNAAGTATAAVVSANP